MAWMRIADGCIFLCLRWPATTEWYVMGLTLELDGSISPQRMDVTYTSCLGVWIVLSRLGVALLSFVLVS